jgi:predicted Zn-dependent protease
VRPAVVRLAFLPLLVLGACRTGDIAGNAARTVFGGRAGDVTGAFVQSAVEFDEQLAIQFSPEQEYYVGRGVAANAIATYGLDPDEARQAYVRKVGASLVALSPRVRSTYGGYHFAVLRSDQANGVSGPGGFVFVTRGALDLARNEDEVAGILAHEMAHVSLKHGEAVIRASEQWKTQLKGIARVGAAAAGMRGRDANRLVGIFGDTVSGFTKHLANAGYGKELEFKADVEGSYILYEAGYDAGAIASYLKTMPDRPKTAWAAHPESAERIAHIESAASRWAGSFDGGVGFAARSARFQQAATAASAPTARPSGPPEPPR